MVGGALVDVAGGQVDLDEQLQGPDQDPVEGGAPVLDPGAVVAGQQRPPGDRPGPLGRAQGLVQPARVQPRADGSRRPGCRRPRPPIGR
jgi:hypothetical protein